MLAVCDSAWQAGAAGVACSDAGSAAGQMDRHHHHRHHHRLAAWDSWGGLAASPSVELLYRQTSQTTHGAERRHAKQPDQQSSGSNGTQSETATTARSALPL